MSLLKMTVVAGEPVEVQVRLEDEDPGVNSRGLVMLGRAEGIIVYMHVFNF